MRKTLHDGAADRPSYVRQYDDLIAKMYVWRAKLNARSHTHRWDRALLAFGESVDDPSVEPMTADEAAGYARQGWGARWIEVADALRAIEAERARLGTN